MAEAKLNLQLTKPQPRFHYDVVTYRTEVLLSSSLVDCGHLKTGDANVTLPLYVDGAKIDGVSVPGIGLTLLSAGGRNSSIDGPPAATTDTLDLHVSEHAWQGDAHYTVAIDGTTIGGVRSALVSHGRGATQDIAIAGKWGAGPHHIGITFINDAYGGTSATDRNFYVDQVTYDGKAAFGAPTALLWNQTARFDVPGPASATALTLHLAEDAWKGDAQYAVTIDGAPVIRNGTVTASNAQGASQAINLQAVLTAGTHDLAISFLNDAYAGTPATDRNLHVKGIDVNGTPLPGTIVSMLSTGTTHFSVVVAAHL